MKKHLFSGIILLALLLSSCTSGKQHLTLIVGSYTGTAGNGLYVFDFNTSTLEAEPVCEAPAVNPSYLALSSDKKMIYTVNEASDASAVSTFAIDSQAGTLTPLRSLAQVGADPCYIALDPQQSHAVTANYSGGSISYFSINPQTRQIQAPLFHLPFAGNGPDSLRQEGPHLHCTAFSPDGNYLLASDLGTDRIYVFAVKQDTLLFTEHSFAMEPRSGPRHIVFNKEGNRAYVITELSGRVHVLDFQDGQLTQKQSVLADTCRVSGSADIHLSPDEAFLYASTRLKGDGIAIFSVNPQDGTLTRIGFQPTGKHPRNFAISDDGNFLFVGCKNDHLIQIFRRDSQTGLLSFTGKTLPVENVSCIKCF